MTATDHDPTGDLDDGYWEAVEAEADERPDGRTWHTRYIGGNIDPPPTPERIEAVVADMRARTLQVTDTYPMPTPLVDGIIDNGTAVVVNAQWGAFKTFLEVDLACHVALGIPWNGHDVPEARNVFILGYEAPASIHMRVRAWCIHHGVNPNQLVGRLFIDPRPPRLTDPIGLEAIVTYLDELDIGLAFVDTIARTARGVKENASEFGDLFHNLDERIANPRRSAAGIAHAGKDASRGIRGHSSSEGAVDSIIRLQRERDPKTDTPFGPATLVVTKRKDDETGTRHLFDLALVDVDGRSVGVLVPTNAQAPKPDDPDPSIDPGVGRARDLVIARLTRERDENLLGGAGWVSRNLLVDDCKRTKRDARWKATVTRPDVHAAIDDLIIEDMVIHDTETDAIRLPDEADPDPNEGP